MYANVLVPIPPGYGEEARRALDIARFLVAPDGHISVLAVVQELPAYLQLQVGPVDLSRSREEIERQLVDDLGADDADDLDVFVRTGHASRVILDFADERGHDCIVMASRESDVGQILLGSTAAAVVRHAQCAVHVLRG